MIHTYLIFVGFLWRLHDNGTSCSGEWPSLAVISSPGHWNWFSSSHEESKYASCPDSPMSIRWHRKQIMGMAQLLGHSLWQHQEEENVFGQFPSVLWYNLVQKHIYCGLRSDRLFWGCVKKWVIGGFILPLPVKVRSSMCHRREPGRISLPTSGEGEPCTIAHVEPENSSWCVRVCIYTYVYGSEWVNTLSLLGCLQSLYDSTAVSGFEIDE